jgi:dTDP-4-amino-4,6-dideoxygalactose transaminase
MIPFKKINLGKSYEEIKPLFESGRIGLGKITEQFENELAEYVGAKHVIAVNSCTSALIISLVWAWKKEMSLDITIPSMTMALVPNAVIQAGLGLIFNDNVDWVGGRYPLEGSKVIDSAHRLRKNDFVGLDPKTKLCYSFYPTKVIGSIDGGAIATSDDDFAKWARSYILYGRNQEVGNKNSWEYEITGFGGKFNYNDVQSAICLEQLHRLDETNAKRQRIAKLFDEEFSKFDDIFVKNDSDYLYRINVQDRDNFLKYMLENGVECGVHFMPLHMMKPFEYVKVKGKSQDKYIRADIEKAYSKTVSLPFYDLMTDEDVKIIINLVKNWRKNYQN